MITRSQGLSGIDDSGIDDVYLSSATVCSQPGDNSCLYHSLCYSLSMCSSHRGHTSASLRTSINNFIRVNRSSTVHINPDVPTTISEAISILAGVSVDEYCNMMDLSTQWGSTIEIMTAVVMFSVNIYIFTAVNDSVRYKLIGTFKSSHGRPDVWLLFTGNHYDSLIKPIFETAVDTTSLAVKNNELRTREQLKRGLTSSFTFIHGRAAYKNFRTSVLASRNVRRRASYDHLGTSLSVSCYRNRAIEAAKSLSRCTIRKEILGPSLLVSSNRNRAIEAAKRLSRCTTRKEILGSSLLVSSYRNRAIQAAKRLSRCTTRNLCLCLPREVFPDTARSRVNYSMSFIDANSYSKTYDELTKFIVCALCGHEGSRNGCVLITSLSEELKRSGIKEKFLLYTSPYYVSTCYDEVFNKELYTFFEDGLLKGMDHFCRSCAQFLKGNNKINPIKSNNYVADTDDSSISSDLSDNAAYISKPVLPLMSLFHGLFAGSIPAELIGLTTVEDSMISIYSAITNMFLAGVKHYKLKGGTCYTIINDLTSVAKELPRMPTIECTAILRHRKSTVSKDYTYRPSKVYSALNWLKINNHLYSDVDLVWSKDVMDWKNDNQAIDAPFIEVSDEEIIEIDEGFAEEDANNDHLTTNTGVETFKIVFAIELNL
jgi:hypothetical protein